MNVKRFTVFAGAVCAAALFALYCTSVNYDNPLDEKGDNFLFGDTTDRNKKISDCQGSECVGSGAGLFSDPTLQCDKLPPEIALVGSQEVTLEYDPAGQNNTGANEFKRLTGDGGNWNGVVTWDGGPRKTPVDIAFELTAGGAPLTDWNGYPGIPRTVGKYIIRYRATKQSNCVDDSPNPTAQVERVINVTEFIPGDTKPPIITLNQPNHSCVVGDEAMCFDPGARAEDGNGKIITNQMTTTGTIDPHAVGTYPITYRVCKTLQYSDGGTKDTCVEATRHFQVKEKTDIPAKPVPVIVLKMFKHRINDKTYNLRDTVLHWNSNKEFREPGASSSEYNPANAIEKIYYVSAGNVVDITNEARGLVTRTTKGSNYEYKLPGAADYAERIVTRTAFETEDCSGEVDTPPEIRWPSGESGNLSIPANTVWDYFTSYTVRQEDVSYKTPHKLGAELGTLDPNRPQPGTYEVEFVAVGGCGRYTTRERNIIVEP